MKAIKRIVNVIDHTITIELPNDFKAETVEVIILSMDKSYDEPQEEQWEELTKNQFLEGYADPDSIYDNC